MSPLLFDTTFLIDAERSDEDLDDAIDDDDDLAIAAVTVAHDGIIAATAKASDRHILSADPTAFRNLPGVEVSNHR